MKKAMWINKEKVKSLLDMKSTLRVVEDAFRQHGLKKVQMPPKIYLDFKKYNGDLRTMPGYLEENNIAGVKIVNVHPDNPRIGLPTVMATIVLILPETGEPLAIVDGTYITDMRTGAAGGIAVKYLARRDSNVIGFVGAGKQAKSQLLAISKVINIEEVKVFDLSKQKAREFVEDMQLELRQREIGNIFLKDKVEHVCECDILVTTTPSKKPIVMNEWIAQGTHINAIGADAPGKQELDPEILRRAKVVVDDFPQASHSGEINVPFSESLSVKEPILELGDVIVGKARARTGDTDVTVFDSTGLAIQDVATTNLVYQMAVKCEG